MTPKFFAALILGMSLFGVQTTSAQATGDWGRWREGMTAYLSSRAVITGVVPMLTVCEQTSSLRPLFSPAYVDELKKAKLAKGIEFDCTGKPGRLGIDRIAEEGSDTVIVSAYRFPDKTKRCLSQVERADMVTGARWSLKAIRFHLLSGNECFS